MRDYCEFFEQIEKDPEAILVGLTIGEYMEASKHVKQCQKCLDSTQRVLDRYDNEPPTIGFHVN